MKYKTGLMVFFCVLHAASLLHAGDLRPLSEGEMASCNASAAFAFLPEQGVKSEDKDFFLGKLLFSAEVSGGETRHVSGTARLEGDRWVLEDYTLVTPARTYARIRPRGMDTGPDFGTLHMGERRMTVTGFIRFSHSP
ncbi:hypothetical protein [Desulfobotulus sp.]|uniref:hypothetical protein n=1 Tax=Desulfobotulus sp. TaxID=1940337 RepID=UPI002A35996B|nr:hypothetical protein [Desulfobotulus sp.]MDY0163450.1 hypothetical protein [Desulfobotulus sp.]